MSYRSRWRLLIHAGLAATGMFLAPCAEAMPGWLGKSYCVLRHPVEGMTSVRATCESQHVIQQQAGGADEGNTIWINAAQHTYLDRSRGKPWAVERPPFNVGDEDLERAYMIGTFATGYHFVLYDHHGGGHLTLFQWDGSTHLLYLWATLVNFPQKEIGYFAFQVRQARLNRPTQFVDATIGVFVDLIEVAVGLCYSILGVILGLLLHPINTVTNLFGLVTFLLVTTVEPVFELVLNSWSIVSFGGERA